MYKRQLLNTYEPWKFAFSQEETDFNNLKEGAWGIIGVPFDSTTSYPVSYTHLMGCVSANDLSTLGENTTVPNIIIVGDAPEVPDGS